MCDSYLCIKNTLVHATTGIALCGLQSGSVQSLDSQAALLQERSLGTRLGKERLLVRPHVLGYWLHIQHVPPTYWRRDCPGSIKL